MDVAVLATGKPGTRESLRLCARIEREVERRTGYRFRVDAKILNTAPISLQYEVIKSGRLVYARDRGARIQYEAGVLSLYLDYAETLDWFDRVLLTKG